MFMAYLLLNYDIKPLKSRPQAKWIAMNIIPPVSATIEVRRKTPRAT